MKNATLVALFALAWTISLSFTLSYLALRMWFPATISAWASFCFWKAAMQANRYPR